jgi:hypothetical protein
MRRQTFGGRIGETRDGWCGARARLTRMSRTRAASGLRPEALRPPARSLADGGRFGPAGSAVRSPNKSTAQNPIATRPVTQSAARRRKENAASGAPRGERPSQGRAAPRKRGSIGCALRRSASPHFDEGRKPGRRGPRATTSGRRSVGCLTIEDARHGAGGELLFPLSRLRERVAAKRRGEGALPRHRRRPSPGSRFALATLSPLRGARGRRSAALRSPFLDFPTPRR